MPGTSDTFTASNRLDKQAIGGNYNSWGLYLNTNFDLIDALKDGNLILTMSTMQHTLTTNTGATDEARMASITVIGTPGGTATITMPNVQKLQKYENLLTGGYPILLTNGTGTTCLVQNGATAEVQCDSLGNIKVLGGSQFGTRRLQNIAQGTASDDAVRMDQFAAAAGRSVPNFGSTGQVLRNLGTFTNTISGTATATTSYDWENQGMATIFLPPSSMKMLSTNGGTLTSLMCTTSSRMIDAIVLGSATSQYASFTVGRMPRSWDLQNLLVSFEAFTTGATGTAVFEMNAGFANIVSGATIDKPFNYSTAALGTEAGTASFDIMTGTVTASVSGGTASSNAGLGIMVRRNIGGGNDNMSGNLFLTGVVIRYNNNLPNDN